MANHYSVNNNTLLWDTLLHSSLCLYSLNGNSTALNFKCFALLILGFNRVNLKPTPVSWNTEIQFQNQCFVSSNLIYCSEKQSVNGLGEWYMATYWCVLIHASPHRARINGNYMCMAVVFFFSKMLQKLQNYSIPLLLLNFVLLALEKHTPSFFFPSSITAPFPHFAWRS